jgi:hypothetical protein
MRLAAVLVLFSSANVHAECSATGAFVNIRTPNVDGDIYPLMDLTELSVTVIKRQSSIIRIDLYKNAKLLKSYGINEPVFTSGENDGEYEFSVMIGPDKSGADITLPVGDQNLVINAVTEDGCESQQLLRVYAGDSRVRAILVGISNYYEIQDSLEYADDDAKDFEGLLRRMFPDVNGRDQIKIRRFIDEDAELEDITVALEDAKSELTRWATLIFYFSGHGMIFKDRNTPLGAYLVTYNGRPKYPHVTMLNKSVLMDKYFAAIPARKKIFILDSCFGGVVSGQPNINSSAGTPKVLVNVSDSIRNEAEANKDQLFRMPQGVVGLVSSSGITISYETKDLNNGIFTYYLMKGIDESDLPKPPKVRYCDLMAYIKNKIRVAHDGVQQPQLLVLPVDNQYRTFVERPGEEGQPP